MRYALLILTIAGAVVALALAVASLVQVPVTKFPTEWEIRKVEQLLDGRTSLTAEQQARLQRSLGWIRSNDQQQLAVHLRLHRLASYGFLCLALLFVVASYFLWSRARTPAGLLTQLSGRADR